VLYDLEETIVAIASPAGGGARGVVRISGPAAIQCAARWFRESEGRDPRAVRRATVLHGSFELPAPLSELPCELWLWPNARSYTRQPSAEIHTIGCRPLLDAALRQVCASGARLAGPGEFTLRAFLAGRLDLTQAEAVLGVIDARGDEELHTALRQLAGGVAAPLAALRGELLDLLADLEAGLDFADEDLEFISEAELRQQLRATGKRVTLLEAQLAGRSRTEAFPRVVLIGWPNVGKSTLFNALAGDAAAMVSDGGGTTRDYLTRLVEVEGGEMLLVDTAGYAPSSATSGDLADQVQQQTATQSAQADLLILCLDGSRPLNDWERARLAELTATPQLVVGTKGDRATASSLPPTAIATSSRTGAGLDVLRRALRERLDSLPAQEELAVANTAARCRESLRSASGSLDRAQRLAGEEAGEELVASEVRIALDELGKVVGAVYTDDLLERVFGRFCIGK
jgi:tRNA modification GTPase